MLLGCGLGGPTKPLSREPLSREGDLEIMCPPLFEQ